MPLKTRLANLRIGDVGYLNTLPLRLGLLRLGAEETFLGNPVQVNQALLEGKIDLAPASSIFYFENQDKFLALRDICIASYKDAKSVIFLSRYPINELSGKRVALTRASATSCHLLRVVFEERKVTPEFIFGELEMFENNQADASLIIGDTALQVYIDYQENYSQGSKPYYLYDLGREWNKLTGKPMVFALWVARKEVVNLKPELVSQVAKLLYEALTFGLSNLDLVVEEAKNISGIDEVCLKEYYLGLSYYMDQNCVEGLLEFYRRATGNHYPEVNFFSTANSFIEVCQG